MLNVKETKEKVINIFKLDHNNLKVNQSTVIIIALIIKSWRKNIKFVQTWPRSYETNARQPKPIYLMSRLS